jgi:integrase
MRLYNNRGHRKYLTPAEQREFLQAARSAPEKVRTFCATLTYTGCRISEALALTADRVDFADGVLVFESLKKRRKGVYRAVPVPAVLLENLDSIHDLKSARLQEGRGFGVPLWDWSRSTAWRRVREIMDAAGISGLHATPKGLRHAFGIKATTSKVPLNLTQKWLGHTQLSTTSIYADAVGPEEKQIAERMWD